MLNKKNNDIQHHKTCDTKDLQKQNVKAILMERANKLKEKLILETNNFDFNIQKLMYSTLKQIQFHKQVCDSIVDMEEGHGNKAKALNYNNFSLNKTSNNISFVKNSQLNSPTKHHHTSFFNKTNYQQSRQIQRQKRLQTTNQHNVFSFQQREEQLNLSNKTRQFYKQQLLQNIQNCKKKFKDDFKKIKTKRNRIYTNIENQNDLQKDLNFRKSVEQMLMTTKDKIKGNLMSNNFNSSHNKNSKFYTSCDDLTTSTQKMTDYSKGKQNKYNNNSQKLGAKYNKTNSTFYHLNNSAEQQLDKYRNTEHHKHKQLKTQNHIQQYKYRNSDNNFHNYQNNRQKINPNPITNIITKLQSQRNNKQKSSKSLYQIRTKFNKLNRQKQKDITSLSIISVGDITKINRKYPKINVSKSLNKKSARITQGQANQNQNKTNKNKNDLSPYQQAEPILIRQDTNESNGPFVPIGTLRLKQIAKKIIQDQLMNFDHHQSNNQNNQNEKEKDDINQQKQPIKIKQQENKQSILKQQKPKRQEFNQQGFFKPKTQDINLNLKQKEQTVQAFKKIIKSSSQQQNNSLLCTLNQPKPFYISNNQPQLSQNLSNFNKQQQKLKITSLNFSPKGEIFPFSISIYSSQLKNNRNSQKRQKNNSKPQKQQLSLVQLPNRSNFFQSNNCSQQKQGRLQLRQNQGSIKNKSQKLHEFLYSNDNNCHSEINNNINLTNESIYGSKDLSSTQKSSKNKNHNNQQLQIKNKNGQIDPITLLINQSPINKKQKTAFNFNSNNKKHKESNNNHFEQPQIQLQINSTRISFQNVLRPQRDFNSTYNNNTQLKRKHKRYDDNGNNNNQNEIKLQKYNFSSESKRQNKMRKYNHKIKQYNQPEININGIKLNYILNYNSKSTSSHSKSLNCNSKGFRK